MKKIKVFLAEDFSGNLYWSESSFDDIMQNTTAALMPGGFSTGYLSDAQIKKLKSDTSYWLHSTKKGLQVRG